MNWQERINQFDAEQQGQAEEAQKTREEQARKRGEGKNMRQREAFALIDRLKVEQILQDIKRDVWKHGEVERFEDNKYVPSSSGTIKIKGIALIYRYQEPGKPVEEPTGKTNLRFGTHIVEVIKGGLESDSIVRYGVGFYKEEEYKTVYPVLQKTTSLSVSVEFFVPWYSHNPALQGDFGSFFVSDDCGGRREFPRTLDPSQTDDQTVVSFLNQALLEVCSLRRERKMLPADIKTMVQ